VTDIRPTLQRISPMSNSPQPMKGSAPTGSSESFSITARDFGPDREKPATSSPRSRTVTPSCMWS
jgi:hypothetical protein